MPSRYRALCADTFGQGARYCRAMTRLTAVLGLILGVALLTACSHSHGPQTGPDGVLATNTGPDASLSRIPTSSAPIGDTTGLRSCASLVGKPTYAAIIGEQLTCSLQNEPQNSRTISLTVRQCPGNTPFYVFYSVLPDALDKNVYFGTEAGPLFVTTRAKNSASAETHTVCDSLSRESAR
jgi:hypothetical protein